MGENKFKKGYLVLTYISWADMLKSLGFTVEVPGDWMGFSPIFSSYEAAKEFNPKSQYF